MTSTGIATVFFVSGFLLSLLLQAHPLWVLQFCQPAGIGCNVKATGDIDVLMSVYLHSSIQNHYPFKGRGRTQIARHNLDVFEGGGPGKCQQAFIF